MRMDDDRGRDVGRRLARRDHKQLRPRNEQSARFWAPVYREGYDEERHRLGDCRPKEHLYEPSRVTSASPETIQHNRPLGALIEICQRCRVWRDRPR